MATPKLSGTWVTSFISWYPVDPTGPIMPFGVVNRLVGWVPQMQWDTAFARYYTDGLNEDEKLILSILAPAPLATLTCFNFNENPKTFTALVKRNNQAGMDETPLEGQFTLAFDATYQVWGGEIRFIEQDEDGNDQIHLAMPYWFVTKDEVKFIAAYGRDVDSGAQSAAGTLRKVASF